MSQWLDDATEVATTVARQVHKKFHTYFDVDDVRQELLMWIVRREEKVQGWLEHDVSSEEYKRGIKNLGKTLNRHADRYCRRKKAQFLGYELRDEQYYTPITLSELLPFVWSDVVDTKRQDGEKVSGAGNPAEGGNYVIQLFDIRRGLMKLNEMDRDVLELKFFQQLTFAEIAQELGVSDTTAHRKVDNALRRLNNHLGGQSPFKQEVEM